MEGMEETSLTSPINSDTKQYEEKRKLTTRQGED